MTDKEREDMSESDDIVVHLRGLAGSRMQEAADLIERLRAEAESPSPFTDLFRSDEEGSVATVEALQAQLAYLEAKMGKLAETVHRHDVQLARRGSQLPGAF